MCLARKLSAFLIILSGLSFAGGQTQAKNFHLQIIDAENSKQFRMP
jgi:hypothetical protein